MNDMVRQEAPQGVSLGDALAAMLAALGRPPALIDGNQQQPEDFLKAILVPLEMDVAAISVRVGERPPLKTPALLVELEGGGWLALIQRPAEAPAELALADGGLMALEDPLPVFTGRAFAISDLPDAQLQIEVKGFLRRNWRHMMPIIAGGTISNVLNLVIPLFGSFVYDKVLGNGVTDTLWAMVLGVLLAVLMDFCTRALRIQLVERMAVASEGDIDRALFRGVLQRSGPLPQIGVVLDKYKQMLSSRDFVTSNYLLAASDLPFLIFYLLCIGLIGGPIVVMPILWGLVVLGLNVAMAAAGRRYDRQARRSGEQRIAILADLLMAREAVVTSRWGDDLAYRWRRVSDSAAIHAGKTRYWNSMAGAVVSWGNSLAYASVLVAGAYMIQVHDLTSGGMMAITMLSSRCLMTVGSVSMLMTRFREFRRAIREMNGVIPSGRSTEQPVRPAPPSGDIQLQGVTWKPGKTAKPVLQGFDLKIRPGEIIGIAGLPGAGKTTLMRLICGVEQPTEGRVLLDMLPVEQWSVRQRARAIGYKTQDAILFDGTLEENIRAGNSQASLDDLRRALEISGLRGPFERGELTLGSAVGPRGSFLSGGQRQMVVLARAVLGSPPILLLDEPSTGFDSQTELALAQQIAALAGKQTVLISSHSRPLLSACTRIIVLQGGRIAADGPRDKILISG